MSAQRRGQENGLSGPHKGNGLTSVFAHLSPWSTGPAPSFCLPGREGTGCLCAGWPRNFLFRLKTLVQIQSAWLKSEHVFSEQLPLNLLLSCSQWCGHVCRGPEGPRGGVGTCGVKLSGTCSHLTCVLLREQVLGCRELPITGLESWVMCERAFILILSTIV